MTRPRILVAATIGRPDILTMFGRLAERAELTFLEFASTPGVTAELYEPYGRLTTWEEHRSARSLLRALRPQLLAMIGIGARNQLALRCEARRQGLRTIHLEHGYRLPLSARRSLKVVRPRPTDGGSPPDRARSSLATHRFFARSLVQSPPAEAMRLLRYALPSVGGASFDALGSVADLRRPDRYVSFAPECFAFHRELDCVPPDLAERTAYVGVPQFDCFRSGAVEPDSGAVVLVDHQLHNAGILGWDRQFHRRWADGIHRAVVDSGRHLVVKAHPGDTASPWTAYTDGSVEVVPSIELLERRARSARAVLGIMSTLQLPLTGLDHMAAVTVEVHPQPGEVLSQRLVEAGVAHPVSSFEALGAALGDLDRLHERQRPGKPAFVERFLHRLDGQATERLAEATLAEAAAGTEAAAN